MTLANHYLFTHAGCMDGSASAILFMSAGGLKKNIRYVTPGVGVDEAVAESKAAQNPSRQLLFVDVCPEAEETLQFLHSRGDFTVIDHHASAARLAGRPEFHIDVANDACGCENFRKWLVRGGMTKFDEFPYRRLCQIVDDHDRWKLQEPMSSQMPVLFSMIGQQEFVERFSDVEKRFDTQRDFYWTPFEADLVALLTKAQQRRFTRLMDRFVVRPLQFEGRQILIAYIVSGEVNCSTLLHEYMDLHPEVDLVCQINLDYNRLSLRSNGKVDILKFAGQYGGGGHSRSGGHPMPDGLIRKIIELVHG